MSDLLEPTPEYELKPKLIYVGKLFGMDLYLDIHGVRDAERKHQLAIKWLKAKTAPTNISKKGNE